MVSGWASCGVYTLAVGAQLSEPVSLAFVLPVKSQAWSAVSLVSVLLLLPDLPSDCPGRPR